MQKHKNVKTVMQKTSTRAGKHRTYQLKHVLGERKTETTCRESGAVFKLDVEKCYFSPRLAEERLRVAKLVKPKEKVLVMFSGVAPYPVIIARNSAAKEIIGVELNKLAHKYAAENVKINKLQARVKVINGDCRKILPKIGKFDRIIMCLPKTNEEFFIDAVKAVAKQAWLHYYTFVSENELDKAADKIKEFCKHKKIKCIVKNISKAGQYAPYVVRARVDVKIKKPDIIKYTRLAF